MLGYNAAHAPMSFPHLFQVTNGMPLVDATQYHTLVGKLQYLSSTILGICYFVNKLAKFMHSCTLSTTLDGSQASTPVP